MQSSCCAELEPLAAIRRPSAAIERRTAPTRSAPAAPPVVDQVVHHLTQLADGAALADEVTGRGIERHHAIAHAPPPLPLGVQPDDALHALADEPQGPGLGIVVVVARVAQDE